MDQSTLDLREGDEVKAYKIHVSFPAFPLMREAGEQKCSRSLPPVMRFTLRFSMCKLRLFKNSETLIKMFCKS